MSTLAPERDETMAERCAELVAAGYAMGAAEALHKAGTAAARMAGSPTFPFSTRLALALFAKQLLLGALDLATAAKREGA